MSGNVILVGYLWYPYYVISCFVQDISLICAVTISRLFNVPNTVDLWA